jgi:spermidine synthase
MIQLPKILDEVKSAHNGLVKVVHVGNTKKIIVDNVLQSVNWESPICKRLYWGRTIEILQEEKPDLKNILVLGLGGGTLIHLIRQSFPEAFINSVELDPVMVEVAKKYFDLDSVTNHRIILEDALKVVVDPEAYNLSKHSFDVLIVDIYVGSTYPDLGKSGNFISALKSMVNSDGLIIFNRIYIEEHQDDVNCFINYVSESLKDVKCAVVAGYTNSDNVLIFGRV